MRHALLPSCVLALALSFAGAHGQEKASKPEKAQELSQAPKGFDAKRDGIDRGKLQTVEYESTTVGAKPIELTKFLARPPMASRSHFGDVSFATALSSTISLQWISR